MSARIRAAAAGAAALAIVAGAGACDDKKPEPKKSPGASSPAAAPTQELTFGKLRIAVPVEWTMRRLVDWTTRKPGDGYRVDMSKDKCPDARKDEFYATSSKQGYTTVCPSFAVLGESWIEPPEGRDIQPYESTSFFHPGTDPSHVCPVAPKKYLQVDVGFAKKPEKLKSELRPVGPRKVEYREWRLWCADSSGKGKVPFVQRLWFFPQSKILIVDEWNTPGLDKILEKASWG